MGTSRSRGRSLAVLLLTGSVLALASCGNSDSLSRTFGLTRDAPDEFMVTTRAPLSMPPDFSLRPPRPGAPRPMEQSEERQAEEALAPQTALGVPQTDSAGQDALVQAAGPPATDRVRRQIDADARMESADSGFVDKLLFWRSPPPPHGIVVDPQKEAQRLRENAALGESPEIGDTPIIQPKKKGWLEGLF